jgi:transposase
VQQQWTPEQVARRLKRERQESVGEILGRCEIVINNWLHRYEEEGIKDLETRAGRGRQPKFSPQNPLHLQTVKTEIALPPQFRR